MSQLILAEGIARQAQEAGVSVSVARVSGALDRLREPFDSPAQWREFLKRTHQTESEVRGRLRLELLNRRLYAQHVSAGPQSAAKAARVSRERLRARTVCRPGYVVALCANSTSPSGAGR